MSIEPYPRPRHAVCIGTLRERTRRLVIKNHGQPDQHLYAEAGENVYWAGQSNFGAEHHYGGRLLLWCYFETGDSAGIEPSKIEWKASERAGGR